jgi:hypothetical protein
MLYYYSLIGDLQIVVFAGGFVVSIVPTAQIFYLMRTNRLGIVLEHQNILHNNRYADFKHGSGVLVCEENHGLTFKQSTKKIQPCNSHQVR